MNMPPTFAELSLELEALVGELEDTAVAIISQARGDFSFSNLGRASTPIVGVQQAPHVFISLSLKLGIASCSN